MMKRLLASFLILFALVVAPHKVEAQFGACLPGFCGAVSTPVGCTQYASFIARTSAIDALHKAAYHDFICGLVDDGIWGKFDVIQLYAAQNSTVALLNLVSASFNSTLHGSPSFLIDTGFTGIVSSSTDYLDTNFNPVTASSPQYTLNSAHIALWNLTNATASCASVGSDTGSEVAYLVPRSPLGPLGYVRINVSPSGGVFTGIASSTGLFLGSRTSSTQVDGYRNGSNWVGGSAPVVAIPNLNMYVLADNISGTAAGCGNQITMISFGTGLTSPEQLLYYNRARTYMTTLGVP